MKISDGSAEVVYKNSTSEGRKMECVSLIYLKTNELIKREKTVSFV